jgi:hypothetical protein
MIKKVRFKSVAALISMLFFSGFSSAQGLQSFLKTDTSQRIQVAPESVFESFREAGMETVDHKLTPAEKVKVINAVSLLPPLHQRILKQHLHSISFMDNMPNTALTSPVDTSGATKTFNITFRASLLDESISQWATWKENTCFKQDSNYRVHVEGGDMDAIIYVLMHEATHIVDAVLDINPHPAEADELVEPTPFTKGIWRQMNKPTDAYVDSLLEQTRFRSGKPLPINFAPEVYSKLAKTPFTSLYAMAAWFEDIAELATIYHLTTKLNQPFYIVVNKGDAELSRFEPMKNELVRQRFDQLAIFYKP